MEDKPSKVCLMLGSEHVKDVYLSEITTMLEATNVEVPLIVIDETTNIDRPSDASSGSATRGGFIDRISTAIGRLLAEGPHAIPIAEELFARKVLRRSTPKEEYLEVIKPRTHLDSIDALRDAERVYFTPEIHGSHTYTVPDHVVDKIVDTTDIVVTIGFGRILRGRILTEPDFGVLSFHGSDIRRYRGRPGCYHQFLNGEDVNGSTLQRLTPELDGGDILVCVHADISDAKTWWDVKLRVVELYGSMLATGIERLRDPEFSPIELTEDELGVLTYSSSKKEWRNAIRMAYMNFRGRYFQ